MGGLETGRVVGDGIMEGESTCRDDWNMWLFSGQCRNLAQCDPFSPVLSHPALI